MAKETIDVPLQKKVDVVVNLLTLLGAEKCCEGNWSLLTTAKARGDKDRLCEAICLACDEVVEHLNSIKTFLS